MREIVMMRSIEGVIAISGGSGTMAEISYAYGLGLPIITLRDAGGWSSRLQAEEYLDRRKTVPIMVADNINELVETLIKNIKHDRRERLIKNMFEKYEEVNQNHGKIK